jgi:hypothetical protein
MFIRSWREFESAITLDELPRIHRAFLHLRGVDPTNMPLRRVQQAVERELNKLVLEGRAQKSGDDILLTNEFFSEIQIGLEPRQNDQLRSSQP